MPVTGSSGCQQAESTVYSRIVAELCQCKSRILAGVEHIVRKMSANTVQQKCSRFGYAAAQHDQFRVEKTAGTGDRFSQNVKYLFQNFPCDGISALCRPKQFLCREFVRRTQQGRAVVLCKIFFCEHHHSSCRGILLCTPAFAAGAVFLLGTVDGEVSQFSRHTVCAIEDFAVCHKAAADPGADSHHQHRAAAFAAAVKIFSECGNIGIVARLDGESCQCAESIVQIEHAPAEIDTAVDISFVIHRSRHTDPDPGHQIVCNAVCSQTIPCNIRDIRQNCRTAVYRACGKLPLFYQNAVLPKQSEFDGGSSAIDSKSVFHIPFSCFFFHHTSFFGKSNGQSFSHFRKISKTFQFSVVF